MKKKWMTAAIAPVLFLLAGHPVPAQDRIERVRPDRGFERESVIVHSGRSAGAAEDSPMRSDRWVRVGYDYDDDGYIDRFEYLNVKDLEMARKSSMERQRGAAMPQGDRRGGETDPRFSGQAGPAEAVWNSVAGTVTDLREVAVAGMDESHLLGKIRTPEGRVARVDLGPVRNLSGLDLRRGDRVTVHGTGGTINDKAMLMAHRIEAGDRMVTVGWPNDRNLARYSGEVLSVRTARFRDPNVPEQVFARVLLDRGGVTAVNLGPSHALRDSLTGDLSGKRIDLLAHPAKIGNRVALVAEELRVDGRTIHVDWSMAGPGA
jgi:hypothetical protein